MNLNSLTIGDLVAKVPIIQGGMGVGVSLSSLAGAVAKEGAIGVISAAQPGYLEEDFGKDSLSANVRALGKHIKKAKEISDGGIIGVNIMWATRNYEEYVKCCIDNGADLIISGAGLPLDLPKFVEGSNIKIAPIVSPPKSARVILKMWDRRYKTTADMVVIEGPKAGGHLGFSNESLEEYEGKEYYDKEVIEILEIVKEYEIKYNKKIPVVFAGGVYDRKDIDHYIGLGCAGVQMATRFVATEECDADINFKMAYINSKKEDIMIVKSPVGMPGRAIRNKFMEERKLTNEKISKCYRCLKKCDMDTIPYCITGALVRAVKGDVDNSLVFCGENAYRLDKITTVKELIKELTE
ncbi:NAD(P)H-dependent flavin oxidoreductase [Clostridium neonatale]|uniref:NAD(P)H-dependent flavin oxidoreductase n=1 Tax=Clostridium neonatale TaxID=137838 RepID=UPI003D34F9A5